MSWADWSWSFVTYKTGTVVFAVLWLWVWAAAVYWYRKFARLHSAIELHQAAKGHGACWLNDALLYREIEAKPEYRELPAKAEFLYRCERYYDHEAQAEGWAKRR